MDEHTEGYADVDGVRLFYRADGPAGAPALVLSNSLGTDLHMWEPQMGPFAQVFRVVRYDCRGHGRSDVPSGPYTLDRLGQDLLGLLDRLGIERTHICGLSLGGMVALWLAISHPARIGRAVFADTAARIGTADMWNERTATVRAGGMRAIRETIVARFLSESFRSAHPAVAQSLGATLEATSPEGYIAACEALRDADLTESVASIRLPSLVIVGALDVATPPAQAEELHRLIAGSELSVLPGAAHLANVDASAAFTERVLTFLQ